MLTFAAKDQLVLHCAILSKPTVESRRLVQYLIQEVPGCLETKSAERHTPLALAYSLHRVDYAGILMHAGASQTVRDSKGNNLIHLLLCGIQGESSGKPENVEKLLGLLDPRLVSSLLVERSSDDPGSLTPFARWMHRAGFYGSEPDDLVAIARHLLSFAEKTGQRHLELLDGTGNTPVHDAVKRQLPRILELMVTHRPDLLHRENATGSTPLELEEDSWVLQATANPPDIPYAEGRSWRNSWTADESIVIVTPESFVTDDSSSVKTLHDICRERANSRPEKRKLVTLNEANEVAKRLATQKSSSWGRGRQADTEVDVVSRWYGRSSRMDELTDVMGI
jgi:hypothetical protein